MWAKFAAMDAVDITGLVVITMLAVLLVGLFSAYLWNECVTPRLQRKFRVAKFIKNPDRQEEWRVFEWTPGERFWQRGHWNFLTRAKDMSDAEKVIQGLAKQEFLEREKFYDANGVYRAEKYH